jgi:hypothetical protein
MKINLGFYCIIELDCFFSEFIEQTFFEFLTLNFFIPTFLDFWSRICLENNEFGIK